MIGETVVAALAHQKHKISSSDKKIALAPISYGIVTLNIRNLVPSLLLVVRDEQHDCQNSQLSCQKESGRDGLCLGQRTSPSRELNSRWVDVLHSMTIVSSTGDSETVHFGSMPASI